VADTERELHEQHQNLTRDLAGRYARLKAAGPEDAGFDEQYADVVERAERLLAFEEQLPAKLAEPQRLRSAKIVRWSWRAQTGVAGALIVAVFALGHTGWWLLLLIPHLVGTLLGWPITVSARHRQQRAAAMALHGQGALVGLVVLSVLSAWWIIAIVLGWVFVAGAFEDQGVKK
jgi:hypothetical protein